MHDEWGHTLGPLSWQHPLLFFSLSTATLTNKYPAGELIFMSIVPQFHTHSLSKSLQPAVYNPYVSCLTQRVTFPHYLTRRMVSHTRMARKRSYGRALMHSQTQWVCRTESHFLLGEVSHCNKAGRGSQGRISTPGRDKWSAVFFFLVFFQGLAQFYSSILHQLISSEFCPEDVLFHWFSHRIAASFMALHHNGIHCDCQQKLLWFVRLLHRLIRVNAAPKVFCSPGFAVVLSAMQTIHEGAFLNDCNPACLICILVFREMYQLVQAWTYYWQTA